MARPADNVGRHSGPVRRLTREVCDFLDITHEAFYELAYQAERAEDQGTDQEQSYARVRHALHDAGRPLTCVNAMRLLYLCEAVLRTSVPPRRAFGRPEHDRLLREITRYRGIVVRYALEAGRAILELPARQIREAEFSLQYAKPIFKGVLEHSTSLRPATVKRVMAELDRAWLLSDENPIPRVVAQQWRLQLLIEAKANRATQNKT